MIPRLAGGWQTTLADLALILFIVGVAGLNAPAAQAPELRPSEQGEASAIYRAGTDAPPIAEWLAEQAPDERQHLTIVARYRPGEADLAASQAVALADQAGEAGRAARIIIEQGEGNETLALLAFDRPPELVARSLQGQPQD